MVDKEGKGEKAPPPEETADLKEMLNEVLGVLHGATQTEVPEDMDPDQMMEDLEATISELSDRAEEMRKMTGLSKEDLDQFAENPDNFSKEEWALLNEIKAELNKYEEEADKIFAEPFPELEGPSAGKEEAAKKKKPKRKGWMRG